MVIESETNEKHDISPVLDNNIMQSKMIFSVVMACFNCEDYLDETINSLINQTLSFEENIQLILVDDGSTDDTAKICRKYIESYPNNITYIYQENQGQGAARNLGLKYVAGKYVNFLDSDDKFSADSFQLVYEFFKNNEADIDFVTVPIFFFDNEEGHHPLNYKFTDDRIVNLFEDWDYPQLHANASFFKSNLFDKYQFATNLVSSEDALMINKILIDNPVYGLVSNAKYFYRKRDNNSSTLDSALYKKEFYLNRLNGYFKELINYSLEKYGEVKKFIQYLTVYDIQWMFRIQNIGEILSNDEITEAYAVIKDILSYLDDEVILSLREDNVNIVHHLLALKYSDVDVDSNGDVSCSDIHSDYDGEIARVYSADKEIDQLDIHKIWIDIIEIKENTLYLSGYLMSFFNDKDIEIEIVRTTDGNKEVYPAKRVYYKNTAKKFLGCTIEDRYNFDAEIPINENCTIEIFTRFTGKNSNQNSIWQLSVDFSYYARLSTLSNYSVYKSYFLELKGKTFHIVSYNYLKMLKSEIPVLLRVLKRREEYWDSILLIRTLYLLMYPIYKNKRIWLFMDKVENADDNAEHLYKYAMNKEDGIKKYFTVSKDSKDFKRLGNIPNLLAFDSVKHRLIYLLAEKIISSHPDEEILNPFINKNEKSYSGLNNADKIFLQHGVTKDNVSSWLYKYEKNLKLIVTVSDEEKKSFLDPGYNYDEEIIQVLGFPRFDNLSKAKECSNTIVIMPSWRKKLLYHSDEYIIESEFFKRINSLINNEKLIGICKKYGYNIIFKPHPRVYEYIELFETNDYVDIDEDSTYQELFKNSDLMITDYSSVAFDFSYMEKPVIYYQYGDDYNFEEGYFKYETMGFGEVVESEEDLVNTVGEYLDNGCKMKDEYKKRVNSFYKYNDKNNCERVYNAILNLKY
ncbi:CDP-glycerol glycerophosphotransferase family protein [Methanobrevibacter sp.]|uniref:bifunctional glycosyltransferase/CDP-glycerol:glycerophosphate glycerophosphotransferase n=1 Tax=Methanobrevibacter sp. TaxID=66852 RepID=UPI003868FE20